METAAFSKRLQEYWTPERRAKFLSGKSFLLTPWQGGELLFALGLLNKDASMSADASRKFIQINHMLQLLLPSLKSLAKNFPKVRVVDAGCGNAYLSFLIAWYFRDILKHPLELIGVDHSQAMVDRANARARQLGYQDSLKFAVADLQSFSWLSEYHKAFGQMEANLRPNCFVALHACDTATDYALAEALRMKSDVIAVAPCCQAELARAWKDQDPSASLPLSPVMRAPHFRRVVAADMTDMLRTLLLRSRGYEVTATEFVASEHTPKNRLMLATRRGNYLRAAEQEYMSLKSALGEPVLKLEALLQNAEKVARRMLENVLPSTFYERHAPELAVALLGCTLVRRIGEQWVGGVITETEAYTEDDEASHSYRGQTPRNAAMFQKAGTFYVYRIYGIHFCLNISSGEEGQGEAVLIRSIEPLWGIELMRELRRWPEPKPLRGLCNGPGKLAQAMAINMSLNGSFPDQWSELQVGPASQPVKKFSRGPRVGITKNVDRPWRFQYSPHL